MEKFTLMVKLLFQSLTNSSARRSFHVIKLWNVFPVFRSHVIKVLRCVDIPIQDIFSDFKFAFEMAF